MNNYNVHALKTLNELVKGVNPEPDSIWSSTYYPSAQIKKVLLGAISAIDQESESYFLKQSLYSNAGKTWRADEDLKVAEEFDAGIDIAQIAIKHGRTPGGIKSRLALLVKINLEPDAVKLPWLQTLKNKLPM